MRKNIIKSALALYLLLSLLAIGGCKSDSTFSIVFVDVGQGDSALVECDGHYMLIDGGDKTHAENVSNVLRQNGVKHLDILAASHVHNDHIGGLPIALENIADIDDVLCNTSNGSEKAFEEFVEAINRKGKSITVPSKGDKYSLGSAIVYVMACGSNLSKNESLVLLIKYKGMTFLFPGDIQQESERNLCDEYGAYEWGSNRFAGNCFSNDREHPITLLKVSHHGSDTSTSVLFTEMAMPEYAIISVGKGYGHPAQQTLDRLAGVKAEIYQTNERGNITVTSNGEMLIISTER